jgi:RNA polymerase sigma factor (sigma-70 family)
MKQGFATDTVLLTLMRSDKTSDNDLALKQLLNIPSVKTGIEALFLDSNFEKYRIDYLCQKAFDALKEGVKEPMKELKDTPTNLYVSYVRNLKEAEYIKMRQSPEMDNILKSLLTDGKVLGTIKSKINSHENIDPKEILSESIKALYEKITNGNFKGKSALKTYFIKICLNKISDIVNHKEIFVELDEDKIRPLWEGTKDPIEDLGVDFTTGFKESEKERQHFSSLVQKLEITPICREALMYQYQKDFDMSQIGAEMNIAMQSAKNNAKRCRQLLKKAIAALPELKAFVKKTKFEGFFNRENED